MARRVAPVRPAARRLSAPGQHFLLQVDPLVGERAKRRVLSFENVLHPRLASKGARPVAGAQTCSPGLRPEALLLLSVASPPGEPETSATEKLLQSNLDWESLLLMGERNDVLPLLYWRLNTGFKERVPPA